MHRSLLLHAEVRGRITPEVELRADQTERAQRASTNRSSAPTYVSRRVAMSAGRGSCPTRYARRGGVADGEDADVGRETPPPALRCRRVPPPRGPRPTSSRVERPPCRRATSAGAALRSQA